MTHPDVRELTDRVLHSIAAGPQPADPPGVTGPNCVMSRRIAASALRPGPLLLLAGHLTAMAACGDEAGEGRDPWFEDRSLTIETAPRGADDVRPLGFSPDAAGVTRAGDLLVARTGTAAAELFRSGPDALEPLPFFTQAPAEELPADTVRAIVPRMAGGAWILAGNGLYRTEGLFYVAVDPSLTSARRAFSTAIAPLDGLWITTEGALIRLSADAAHTYAIPRAEAIRALDVTADGRSAMLVGDGEIRVLTVDGDDVFLRTAVGPPDGAATVGRLDGRWWVGGRVLASTERPGVRWIRQPTPAPVRALGRGPDGRAWWVDDAGVYALGGATAEAVHEGPIAAARFAPTGDLWTIEGDIARRWRAAGARPGFEADILPWLREQRCIGCHMEPSLDFRELEDFRRVASDALFRVETGDMPRCGNDRCPPEEQLSPSTYRILETWIETGMEP